MFIRKLHLHAYYNNVLFIFIFRKLVHASNNIPRLGFYLKINENEFCSYIFAKFMASRDKILEVAVNYV